MSYNARFVQEGKAIDYTAGSAGVSAGDIVVQGGLAGVAKLDIPANATGAIALDGVYEVVKDSVAVSAGAIVYWDATSSYATTVSSGNTRIGLATEAVTSGATVVNVKLNA